MEIYILVALICAGIGYALDEGQGCMLGLLLGPVGLIIAAIAKGK